MGLVVIPRRSWAFNPHMVSSLHVERDTQNRSHAGDWMVVIDLNNSAPGINNPLRVFCDSPEAAAKAFRDLVKAIDVEMRLRRG